VLIVRSIENKALMLKGLKLSDENINKFQRQQILKKWFKNYQNNKLCLNAAYQERTPSIIDTPITLWFQIILLYQKNKQEHIHLQETQSLELLKRIIHKNLNKELVVF
jgi:hypothetical protein